MSATAISTSRNAHTLRVVTSSASCEWSTPQELFDRLDAEFGFDLDVCATADNAKCARYFTAEDDGLAQAWSGTCWMNPPYGRQIGRWVRKAHESSQLGVTVVCLVPARVDTRWWHDHCVHAEVRFLPGRLRFGGGETGAPFPSAVVVFDGGSPCVRWGARCATCREQFVPTRSDSRYCSPACRQRAYRKRKKAASA